MKSFICAAIIGCAASIKLRNHSEDTSVPTMTSQDLPTETGFAGTSADHTFDFTWSTTHTCPFVTNRISATN